jgi:hypothetical protein
MTLVGAWANVVETATETTSKPPKARLADWLRGCFIGTCQK